MVERRFTLLLSLLFLVVIFHTASAQDIIVVLKDDVKASNFQEVKLKALERQSNLLNTIKNYEKLGKVKRVKQLWLINGIALNATDDVIAELKKRKDVKIIPNYRVKLLGFSEIKYIQPGNETELDTAWGVRWVEADQVWKLGINGSGVKVAVVDTGIEDHPDLSGKIVAWKDFVNGDTFPYDDNGHGTHVAGIIAGTGKSGIITGVAPGAKLIGVKVFDWRGSATVSDIIAGFQWSVEQGADIISYSGGLLPIDEYVGNSKVYANTPNIHEFNVSSYIYEEAYKPAFIIGYVKSVNIGNLTVSLIDPNGSTADIFPADWITNNDGLSFIPVSNDTFIFKHIQLGSPLPEGQWKLKVTSKLNSSNWMWFSGEGNNLNVSLYRLVDLTNTSRATLRFWTSYNIGSGFDYGYVEVVENGSVQVLKKLTGQVTSQTIEINLSSYAGKQIVLRFRYVTDSTSLSRGWYIDNVEIPEIGFRDEVDETGSGWSTEGWKVVSDVNDSIDYSYGIYVFYPSDGTSIIDEAVNQLVENGTVIVAAAGNEGIAGLMTLNSPATASRAIAVGATDYMSEQLADFSSKGPAGFGSNMTVKPDFVAPGVNIVSTSTNGGYTVMSGTSMATPHISGIIALMLQANPNLTPDEVVSILRDSSVDLGEPGKDNLYGYGRVSALKAVQLALGTFNGSINGSVAPIPVKLFAGATKNLVMMEDNGSEKVGIVAISWDGKPVNGTEVHFIVRWVNYSGPDVEVINVTKFTNGLGYAEVILSPDWAGEYIVEISDEYGNNVTDKFFAFPTFPEFPIPINTTLRRYISLPDQNIDMKFTVVDGNYTPFSGNLNLVIAENYSIEVLNESVSVVNGQLDYQLNLSKYVFDDGKSYFYGAIYLIKGKNRCYAGDLEIIADGVKVTVLPEYIKARPGQSIEFVVHAYEFPDNKPVNVERFNITMYWLKEQEIKSLIEQNLAGEVLGLKSISTLGHIESIESIVNSSYSFTVNAESGLGTFNITVPDNVYIGFVSVDGKSLSKILVNDAPFVWNNWRNFTSDAKIDLEVEWKVNYDENVGGYVPENNFTVKVTLYNSSGYISNATVYVYTESGGKVVVTDGVGRASVNFSIINSVLNTSDEIQVFALYQDVWAEGYAKLPPLSPYSSNIFAQIINGNLYVEVSNFFLNRTASLPFILDIRKVAGGHSLGEISSEYINSSSAFRTYVVKYGEYEVSVALKTEFGYQVFRRVVGYYPVDFQLSDFAPSRIYMNPDSVYWINVTLPKGGKLYLIEGGENFDSTSYNVVGMLKSTGSPNITLKAPPFERNVVYSIGVVTPDFSLPYALSGEIVTTQDQFPDLTLSFDAPEVVNSNENLSISVKVLNLGTATSGQTALRVYLDEAMVGEYTIQPIPTHGMKTLTLNLSFSEGLHRLVAVADFYNTSAEFDENNNIAAFYLIAERAYNVSGRVITDGINNSPIYIAVYQEFPFAKPILVQSVGKSFSLKLRNGTYYMLAFADSDSDGALDTDEPVGYAINKSVLTRPDVIAVNGGDVSGVNITLRKGMNLKGDVNGDWVVSVSDVVNVAYMVVNKVQADLKADFNGNGKVDVGDLAKLAYYLLGKIDEI